MRRLLLPVLLVCAAAAGRGSSAAARPTFVYAYENALTRRLWAYQLGTAGQLTALPNSPITVPGAAFTGGGPCGTAAYSRARKTLFLAGLDGITVLQVAKNGTAKPVSGSPFGGAALLGLAAVDVGSKSFVYAAAPEQDKVYGFTVATNGSLKPVPGSPFAAGDHPVTLAATGKLLFAANTQGGSVSAYQISTGGALKPAPGTPFALNGSTLPFGLVADSTGPYVYAADGLGTAQVFGLRAATATGALTPLPSSPTAVPTVDVSSGLALAGPSLLFAFQMDGSGVKDIQALRRGPSGTLTLLGEPQSSGVGVDLAVVDPTNRFLIGARSQGDRALRTFSISAQTGVLIPAATALPPWSTVDGLVAAQP